MQSQNLKFEVERVLLNHGFESAMVLVTQENDISVDTTGCNGFVDESLEQQMMAELNAMVPDTLHFDRQTKNQFFLRR